MARDYPFLRRKGRTIPFGYRIYDDDPQLLEPVVEELEALDKAEKLIKQGCSYRDTVTWLVQVTGRSLSHVGLYKRLKNKRALRRRAVAAAQAQGVAA